MGMNKGPTKAAADLEAYRVAYRVAMEILRKPKSFRGMKNIRSPTKL
jgi:hypothetical protein